ncbi:MAG: SGNH/GDSL hydrolase family protein [Actinomycetota bacterium]
MARVLSRVAIISLTGALGLLGLELALAMRRDFFTADPKAPISGEFGDKSLPALSFMVLGDSTSVGLGAEPHQSFSWLLGERLGKHFHTQLKVLGTSGAKTADVADRQVGRAVAMRPDLVLIEIGANDATHLTPVKQVRSKMRLALATLSKAGIKVVVAGPPDMGTSRAFAEPLRSLSGFNGERMRRAIQAETRAAGVVYVELAQKTGPAFQADPAKYYSTDLFHPGAEGYKLYADVMFPGVLKAAGGPRATKAI